MHAELCKCSISKCSQEMKTHNIASSCGTMELKAKETFTRGAVKIQIGADFRASQMNQNIITDVKVSFSGLR